jgi:hypothetical protein
MSSLPKRFLTSFLTALLGSAELRILNLISSALTSVPVLVRILNPKAKSCSIQHCHLPASDSLEGQLRLEERCWGFQGGMPLWSQGEAREGEAVNSKGERWKGESTAVPPPKRVVMPKSSMVASTIPKSSIYHGNKDAFL